MMLTTATLDATRPFWYVESTKRAGRMVPAVAKHAARSPRKRGEAQDEPECTSVSEYLERTILHREGHEEDRDELRRERVEPDGRTGGRA
jgi:hypothetical protein